MSTNSQQTRVHVQIDADSKETRVCKFTNSCQIPDSVYKENEAVSRGTVSSFSEQLDEAAVFRIVLKNH